MSHDAFTADHLGIATMGSELFRKSALQTLSAPEQLNQTLEIASPRSWIALGAAGLVLGMVLLWSMFGVLPDSVSGEGIIIRNGGIFNIVAGGNGVLAEFPHLVVGDTIRKGQVLGKISQPALALQVAAAKADLGRLQAEAKSMDEAFDVDPQIVAHRAKRAPSPRPVGATDYLERRTERLRALNDRIETARVRLQALELQHQLESAVVSEFDGVVVELMAMQGENVRSGAPVLSLEVGQRDLEVMIFMPQHGRAKRIKPGMAAQISPSDAASERYGYMLGTVVSVSKYPATEQGMMAVFNNASLVRELSKTGPPLAVLVRLMPDPASASGYQWSTQAGRKLAVTSGTMAAGTFLIENYRPISLLVPLLKQTVGM
jgi:multidrug resistance efflux pump